MSVWYTIPSCLPRLEATRCFEAWKEMGYKVAILRQGEPLEARVCDIQVPTPFYQGYPVSVNSLVACVLGEDPHCEWVVYGGDDYYPDTTRTARQIAQECCDWFEGIHPGKPTMGVMQPTGDRSMEGEIDTAAASPWIGREFCTTIYGGRGPLWMGYWHYYTDRELQEVALLQGVFQQRRDLTQLHRHWTRLPGGSPPSHLWEPIARMGKDRDLFYRRKADGFPGWDERTK